jgi:hypothetical protein
MISHEIKEPYFDVKIHIIAKCKASQAQKEILRLFNVEVDLDNSGDGFMFEVKEGRHFCIWYRLRDDQTISHEASHVFDEVCVWRGLSFDPGCPTCSEMQADIRAVWFKLIKDTLKK